MAGEIEDEELGPEDGPQDEPEDDPEERSERELEILGIDREIFSGVLDDAIEHAADAARVDAAAQPWVPMGPRNVGGRIRALAAHPSHPGTIYAGSAFGGLWRTTDDGDTWTPLDAFRPPAPPNDVHQALPIGAIAVAHLNPSIIYVGTGEPSISRRDPEGHFPGAGFYRSDDGGATFRRLDHPATGTIRAHRFEHILVDPWEPERYWIACPSGLWRREPGAADFVPDPVDPPDDASDVLIPFGNPSDPPPATFTVYAALRGKGIYRRVFDRASGSYTGNWEQLSRGLPNRGFQRVKIALCRSQPDVLYAVFAQNDTSASRVYRSRDRGDRWDETGRRPGDSFNKQAYYNLVLEVHPENPDIVFFGTVDLFRTLNGGEGWTKVLDWNRYNQGDRAQHADQHALLFDPVDPRRIWVANDGGISMSPDLGGSWRKRSHGILAAQPYDITVHPVHPFIQGGGMQDNGSWVSFGGPSWFYLSGGDGGTMGFEPDSVQSLMTTVQGKEGSRRGVYRVRVRNVTDTTQEFLTPMPDVPPDHGRPVLFRSARWSLTEGFERRHIGTFVGVLEHHPTQADHALVGRERAGYVTTDGENFTKLETGDFTPPEAEVSALAYAALDPDNIWWLGTSKGEVFLTADAGTTWNARTPPGIADLWVSRIAVHPANDDIVAVAVADSPGQVFLSGNRGQDWWEISGAAAGVLHSPAADALGSSPVTSIVFDPQSPPGVADDQVLYIGTLAGIYVIRNARAATVAAPPAGTPHPVWRTFNRNLPLVLIYDLATVVERNLAPIVVRRVLRCATYGRGVWECDLAGAPEVRLYIRDTVIDDGLPHVGAAALTDDPRLVVPTPLDPLQSFDIRVDAPPFSFFERTMDGVEFDEDLIPDRPVAGERNVVYVQVHNGGWRDAAGVTVHLFWTEVPAGGPPPSIPNLQAGFWASLAAPPAGDWQLVAAAETVNLPAGQPAVASFDWTPPITLRTRAALLAVAEHPGDPMPPIPALPLVINDLLQHHTRAAVRVVDVTPFAPDVFLRDGIDDDGRAGSIAWGGRSPDVIVTQALVANPDVDFRDLADRRPGDKVKGGVDNHAYLRLHNRKSVPLDVNVELFQAPLATLHDHATWIRLGGSGPVQVPPKGWRFAPVITWRPVDPDAAAPAEGKAYALVAVAILADDPGPDFPTMANLKDFWGVSSPARSPTTPRCGCCPSRRRRMVVRSPEK